MGHWAGLDGCGNYRAHRVSVPGPPSPYRVAVPTELSGWRSGKSMEYTAMGGLQVLCSSSAFCALQFDRQVVLGLQHPLRIVTSCMKDSINITTNWKAILIHCYNHHYNL